MTARIKKGYVDTPDGQIHYHTAGEGPAVVWIHQNPSSANMWDAILPGLAAEGFQAIAFDTPGYGESEKPPVKPTIDYYGQRFDEALKLMGIDNYAVGGHHTGALIAAAMGVAFPDRVTHVVAVGIPLLGPGSNEVLRNTPKLEFSADPEFIKKIWEQQISLGGQWFTPEIGVRDTVAKLQAGADFGWAYHAVGAFDQWALIPKLEKTKTLLITGEGDTMVRYQVRAAKILPTAKTVVVPDGGVNLPDDQPEAFVREVGQFLREA